jgi:hypothetical protein
LLFANQVENAAVCEDPKEKKSDEEEDNCCLRIRNH